MRRRRNKTSSRAPNLRPTKTQPHGCGAGSATHRTPHVCSRTPLTTTSAGRQRNPFPSGTEGRRHGCRRPCGGSQREPSRHRCRRLCTIPCGPDGPHINRNNHRETSHREARRMRARMSNAGPTMVEPHGCGAGRATHRIPLCVRAHLRQRTGAGSAHSRRQQAPALKATRSHPALKVGGMDPCGPDGPHMNRNNHRGSVHFSENGGRPSPLRLLPLRF